MQSLILSHARSLVQQGRSQTLSGWLEALPEAIREENSWLLYWRGMCFLPYDQSRARGCLERAFLSFAAGEEPDPLYLTWIGIIDSFVIEYVDFRPIGPWLDQYPTLAGGRKPPSTEIEAASIFSYVTGLMYFRPEHPNLEGFLRQAENLFAGDVERWFMQ